MKPMPSHENRRRRWGLGGPLLVGGLVAVLGLLAAPASAPAAPPHSHANIRHDLRGLAVDFAIFFDAKASDFRHSSDAKQKAFELRMLLREFVYELAAGNDFAAEEELFLQLLDFLTNGS
jgi:hypothetical protein